MPPSADNWFGADDIGRDVFSQVIWGGRTSLLIGVSAVAFGFVIGGTLGLTAGYFGGRYEKVVIGSMDIMLAFPALVLALALVTFLSEPGTQEATRRDRDPDLDDPGRSRPGPDHARGHADATPSASS